MFMYVYDHDIVWQSIHLTRDAFVGGGGLIIDIDWQSIHTCLLLQMPLVDDTNHPCG